LSVLAFAAGHRRPRGQKPLDRNLHFEPGIIMAFDHRCADYDWFAAPNRNLVTRKLPES
jgi:hypothetical protein